MTAAARGHALPALLAVVALAPAAGADERESNRFSFHPSVQVTTLFDDNVFFEKGGEDADVGTWIRPRVDLGYEGAAFDLGVEAGFDFRRYADSRSRGDELVHVASHAELGVLPGLRVLLEHAFVPQPQELGLPPDEGPNLVQTNRGEGRIRYWRELPRGFEIELGAGAAHVFSESFHTQYPGPAGGVIADDHFRVNYFESSVSAEVLKTLERDTTAFLRGGFRHRSFQDGARDADHGLLSLRLGARTLRFHPFELEVEGGIGLIDFEEYGHEPHWLARARVAYEFETGLRLGVSGHHTVTSDLTGNEFLETTVRFDVEQSLGERTVFVASGFLTRYQDEGWDRGRNDLGGAEARLVRQLTQHGQMALAYRYWRNAGPFETDDFRQNRVVLEFTWRR